MIRLNRERGDEMKHSLNTIIFVWKRFLKVLGYKYNVIIAIYWIFCGLSAYFTLFVPSKAIKVLQQRTNIDNQFISLVIWSFVLVISVTVRSRLYNHMRIYTFYFRVMEGNNLLKKIVELPYTYVSSKKGKEDFGNSRAAVLQGNEIGIENLILMVLSLGENIISIMIYSILSISLHPAIFLILFITNGIRMIKDIQNSKWQKLSLNQLEKTHYEVFYINSICLDNKIGKDGRLYSMKDWINGQFSFLNNKLNSYDKDLQKKIAWAEYIGSFGNLIKNIICYGYLVYRVSNGMEISQFVLYLGVINGVSSYTQRIFYNIQEVIKNVPICAKYQEYLKNPLLVDIKGTIEIPKEVEYIYEFQNVSFGYEKEKNVISHLNLTIKSGEKIALVGENGAGKTTLVSLLIGLIQPTEGKILLNGKDISKMTPTELYKITKVVSQGVSVLPATIKENIICGDEIDEKRLHQAIKDAGLDEFVSNLPRKEDTMLTKLFDKDGIELSGGQYQRLMLARALYKDANVLILDEPTAALDPIAEAYLYEKYNLFTKGKTSIFISHRLSSTRFCDRILFMKDGEIIEDGNHKELMNQGGEYKKMFDTQAYYYKKEEQRA